MRTNSLIKNKLYDKLFANVNKQLEDAGLIASGGKDVLVDATLTKSDNNTIKNKNKEQKSETRIRVEADNKAIDVLIPDLGHKIAIAPVIKGFFFLKRHYI
jgi:hypothetical protein